MALGASRSSVQQLVVRQGVKLAAIGLGIGLLITLAVAKVASGLLYGVSPFDALTYALVLVVLGLVATLASFVPAQKASKISPSVAMRAE